MNKIILLILSMLTLMTTSFADSRDRKSPEICLNELVSFLDATDGISLDGTSSIGSCNLMIKLTPSKRRIDIWLTETERGNWREIYWNIDLNYLDSNLVDLSIETCDEAESKFQLRFKHRKNFGWRKRHTYDVMFSNYGGHISKVYMKEEVKRGRYFGGSMGESTLHCNF